jgi:hypothetical protein
VAPDDGPPDENPSFRWKEYREEITRLLIGDQESPTSSHLAGHVVHFKREDALLCRFNRES